MIKKYIRFSIYENKFYYCTVEQSRPQFNKEYGEIEEKDIPPEIANEAKQRAGIFPSWVEIKHVPQSDP